MRSVYQHPTCVIIPPTYCNAKHDREGKDIPNPATPDARQWDIINFMPSSRNPSSVSDGSTSAGRAPPIIPTAPPEQQHEQGVCGFACSFYNRTPRPMGTNTEWWPGLAYLSNGISTLLYEKGLEA